MSLVMMALRVCAVEALKSAGTIVGDHVLDSQISAIDVTADGSLTSDQQRPFIAVYTDVAKAEELGASGLRENGLVDLVFNSGVSMAMAVTDKETGASEIIQGLPATDAHFEVVLDTIDSQIVRALTDDGNVWAQIFGGFVKNYVSKSVMRSSATVEATRIAAGQTKLVIDAWADPVPGAELAPDGHWGVFLSKLAEVGHSHLQVFQNALAGQGTDLYQDIEALTALTTQNARSLLLYEYSGVTRDTRLTDATSEAVPE